MILLRHKLTSFPFLAVMFLFNSFLLRWSVLALLSDKTLIGSKETIRKTMMFVCISDSERGLLLHTDLFRWIRGGLRLLVYVLYLF